MAGEFAETTLGNLLSFANGRSSPRRDDGLPFPVYGSNGVIGNAREANAEANSIIIGRVGSYCGSLYLSKQKCWVTDNAIRATARGDNDSRFLYYLLSTLSLNNWRAGSGHPLLNQDILSHIPALAPTPMAQRAIAHILGTLDDKIELIRRMNETLEAMARALFKSWFVDFDPVRAKAESRDPGLPKSLADLFPDSFESSELGEIPKGWATRQMKEVLSESNERIGETTAPEYSSTNHGLQLRSERFKKELSASSAKNKLIRKGYLVFGLSRRVLNFGLMRDGIGSVSSAYKVFAVDKEIVTPDLLERMMRLRPNYFYNAVSASSREGQSLSSEGLGLLRFVKAPRTVEDAFYRIAGPLSDRISALQNESQNLTALRDTLLPKLISGELRVKDAERCLGGHL